jgi:hypothetical protein
VSNAESLYILRGPAKSDSNPRYKSVQLTYTPSAALKAQSIKSGQGGNYSLSVNRVGYNVTVGHGLIQCQRLQLFNRN